MDIGAKINHYTVVEHIGRGGMADVWSARDQRLNRMVAIKTIAPSLDSTDDPVRMFKREAQTIAQMEHPHVLPIYDFGDFENRFYIVMRYVTGGSLGDQLVNGPLDPHDVLRYTRLIAGALDYAHANKVVHLDLKPHNVLLDSYQTPYLADFGLASPLDREGRAANPGSGTLLYMSPEQLISNVVDKRADIYAFALMIYHLLTGGLPFDGAEPLAVRQIQSKEDLPPVHHLPVSVTEILRRGCAMDADLRPASAIDIVSELESVMSESIDLTNAAQRPLLSHTLTLDIHNQDANLLEAVDLYTRAHYAWSGGQGKFLLGVTHFMLINDYYSRAEEYGLKLDLEGYQMMLRGALEYDRDIDLWWSKLDVANRRWVCLHTIRSESPPARIRALYRLETMPDGEMQRIPRLVAQSLQIERDEQAQIAALKVLGTRARLIHPAQRYDIDSDYRGRMLSTITRVELQVTRDDIWHETIFTPEIDTLIAEMAIDSDYESVRELAARTVGRMRSLAGVQYIANALVAGERGASKALAYVRDEAPNLPPIISRTQRFRAWSVNTWRRLTENALALTWRFIVALIGGAIGMGIQVYVTYRSQAIFDPDRLVNAYGFGLAFGVAVGMVALFADEIPARLRGFWRWWTRLIFSALTGSLIGTMAWALVSYMYLRQTSIHWDLMVFGGVGIALGFILSQLLQLRGWLAVLLTAVLTYLPIYLSWHNACWQYQLCVDAPPFSVGTIALIGPLIGLFAGLLLRAHIGRIGEIAMPVSRPAQAGLGLASGIAFGLTVWVAMMWSMESAPPTWGTLTLVLVGGALGGLLVFRMVPPARAGYTTGALMALFAVLWEVDPMLRQTIDPITGLMRYAPIVGGEYIDFLFGFDDQAHLFSATVAFALAVGLGGHAMRLISDVRDWLSGEKPRALDAAPLLPAPVVAQEDLVTLRVSTDEVNAMRAAAQDLPTRQLDPDIPAMDMDTYLLQQSDRVEEERAPDDLSTKHFPPDLSTNLLAPESRVRPIDEDLSTKHLPPDMLLPDDEGEDLSTKRLPPELLGLPDDEDEDLSTKRLPPDMLPYRPEDDL